MTDISILLVVGSAIIVSLFAGSSLARFRLPVVIGYVLAGIILGKSFLNILSPQIVAKASLINDLALGVIAFLIGAELNFSRLKSLGGLIFLIAIFESLGAFFLVFFSVYLLTYKLYLGLILGAVASATAPAVTVAVINQYKAKGPLTSTLLGVVGSDDAIALIIYSFCAAIAYPLIVHERFSFREAIFSPFREIFFSIFGGILLGFILSYLLNKTKERGDAFSLIVGFLLIAEGLSYQFNLSELLLVMSMAIVGVNFSSHKFEQNLTYLNIVGFPLIASFFCLASTRLDLHLLTKIGFLGFVYLLARILGKYLGARLGAKLGGASFHIRKYIGLCLWPQIGVALALTIVIERDFSMLGQEGLYLSNLAINILLFTTIFTETLGALATRFSLLKSREIQL